MKRTLVTGGSGFVGANLVRRLLKDGHQVTLLLRPDSRRWRLESVLPDCQALLGDVADAQSVARAFAEAQPDWVFHLAAYGAYPDQTSFAPMLSTNVLGCAHVMESAARCGVEAFVQTGSSSEYGFKSHATHEADLLEPNSPYAIAKAAASHTCLHLARALNLPACTLRLYSIYGPFEEPSRFIPKLLVHCLDEQLPPLAAPDLARDFVYVDDAVAALLLAAEQSAGAQGAIFNVCSGRQTTLAGAVALACKLLDVSAAPRWGSMNARSWDANSWVGDAQAIKNRFGWQATTPLSAGLSCMVEWLRANPSLLAFYRSQILAGRLS